MSIWTHVAGCIRIDSIRIDKADEKRDIKKISEAIRTDIPTGSEGTLNYRIAINYDLCYLAAYVVTIFGDLRDYDNIAEIEQWFNAICSQFFIRQAVLTIECENGQTKTITYKEKEQC